MLTHLGDCLPKLGTQVSSEGCSPQPVAVKAGSWFQLGLRLQPLTFGQRPVHSCQHGLLERVTHKGAIIQLHE